MHKEVRPHNGDSSGIRCQVIPIVTHHACLCTGVLPEYTGQVVMLLDIGQRRPLQAVSDQAASEQMSPASNALNTY